jgi:hypothetical protein
MVKSIKELIINDRLFDLIPVVLIEASPDANFIIDFEGKITEVNAANDSDSSTVDWKLNLHLANGPGCTAISR